ncbi:ATP-binding cassette domain-containing protein [Parasulfitobacter algicola]|uniref:ATP-binding cassette domain-containing protein n=1 Tax=Parasulfitobacter algicola TaxID=2614809 RepID=UPI001FE6A901|nr:ATP-binding cassette domain-containing protein [Sulfitobacter algicola]
MPTKETALLSIDAMSAAIGQQGILHDISFTVDRGDWLGIVGGSGAGKSTLLKAILGARRPARPQAGSMIFDGVLRPFAKGWSGRPKGIAYVPQSPTHGLDPLRRIKWQWTQLFRCKCCVADYKPIFTALGLPDPEMHFPHEWSLGMQQRLLLAMALVEEPKLLILDEPTSALDTVIAAQVLTEVERIARDKSIAVLMVTHDLALAARFSNQITIMEQGRIVESGPTDTVLNRPQHPYARDLVAHRAWQRAETANA